MTILLQCSPFMYRQGVSMRRVCYKKYHSIYFLYLTKNLVVYTNLARVFCAPFSVPTMSNAKRLPSMTGLLPPCRFVGILSFLENIQYRYTISQGFFPIVLLLLLRKYISSVFSPLIEDIAYVVKYSCGGRRRKQIFLLTLKMHFS